MLSPVYNTKQPTQSKRIYLVSVCFLLAMVSNAQVSLYLTDLAALKSILQKTASYKAQIKGDALSYYNALYNRLVVDTASNPNSYKYFYNLSQLLFPLRDNHLGFYQNYYSINPQNGADNFITTKEFPDYPASEINIDSLKTELAKKHTDSIEGIYYYDKLYTVGLFKNSDKEHIGLILDSDTSLWTKRQIAIHLYEYAPNLYKAIYRHPLYKNFILQTHEKYMHQSLVNSYFYASPGIYSKKQQQKDYANLPKGISKFSLKNINDNIQYLLIQSFQADNITTQGSHLFYDSIKNSLKAPDLILDLRNNAGGAEKEMRKYLGLLKKYLSNGHLYVLLNNGTVSQAEIFTLELKKLKNVTTAGQRTRGMLAYGSNYGKRERLPSGIIEIYPTDMKNDAELLQYEDYGINPDVILNENSSWIEQLVEIIRKK